MLGDGFLARQRLLVITPHADDETYGCAGTIARVKALGGEVYVVLVSIADVRQYAAGTGHRTATANGSANPSANGSASPSANGSASPSANGSANASANGSVNGSVKGLVSGQTRLTEFESVMKLLGVDDWDVLFTDERTHLALDTVPRKEIVRLLEADGRLAIDVIRPTMALIPASSYNQDHEALYRACVTATRPGVPGGKYTVPFVLAYDNTSLFWVPEQSRFHPTVYVDVSDYLAVKLDAMRLHASQLREPLYHGSLEGLELATKVRGREVGVAAAEGFALLRGVF
ncbi:MAG TPA: PIG-L deacetylase family protein [Mycobacteriales bacterium]|nr:PIG-L deacetylase family protein [Mycobacteriales bacterium]